MIAQRPPARALTLPRPKTTPLARDVARLIESARRDVAQTANAALTTLYWQIGARIRRDVLKNSRAEYGAEIVAALLRRLGWPHFTLLIPLKQRFYAEMCRIEGRSTRTLRANIDDMAGGRR